MKKFLIITWYRLVFEWQLLKLNFQFVFLCEISDHHDWTCKAMQLIPPTEKQLDAGIEGFKDYAKMYCSRCGKISKYSEHFNGRFYEND